MFKYGVVAIIVISALTCSILSGCSTNNYDISESRVISNTNYNWKTAQTYLFFSGLNDKVTDTHKATYINSPNKNYLREYCVFRYPGGVLDCPNAICTVESTTKEVTTKTRAYIYTDNTIYVLCNGKYATLDGFNDLSDLTSYIDGPLFFTDKYVKTENGYDYYFNSDHTKYYVCSVIGDKLEIYKTPVDGEMFPNLTQSPDRLFISDVNYADKSLIDLNNYVKVDYKDLVDDLNSYVEFSGDDRF